MTSLASLASRRLTADALRLAAIVCAAGAAISWTSLAVAQPAGDPAPASEPAAPPVPPDDGQSADDDDPMAANADDKGAPAPDDQAPPARFDSRGRRIQSDEPTVLAFKSVGLDQILPFIVETTGKVVVPQRELMTGRTITVINDQPIPREEALELVMFALQQNGIAAVETDKYIILRDINEIALQDVPVIGPDESVLDRNDIGFIYEKVFALYHSSAENIHEIVKNGLPPFAKSSFDAESNQVVVMGNLGLLQRVERLITSLDRPGAAALSSETFHLRYADAAAIAQNVKDLYSATTSAGSSGGNRASAIQQFFRGAQQGGRGGNTGRSGGGGGGDTPGSLASANLRVTANTAQNSVTVVAEKSVIDQVREHIFRDWDRPLPEEAVVPRVYTLRNSDPIKIRDLLNTLFGSGATATGGGQARQGQNQPAASQGAGRLQGQFSFEAIPEKSQLVVVAKSPDNLAVIDTILNDLDQPQTAGLPQIVELKHASAEELAEQLNALLAQEGTTARILRQASGLSEGTSTSSPFAADQADNQATQGQTATQFVEFWWQRARVPTTNVSQSNLVAKVRIVPVWRQNALMIMSPPEYQTSLVALVEQLDKPGRQVLLAAVIAEISDEDATALGLRWSNSAIIPANQDNAISIGANSAGDTAGGVVTGTKNNLLPSLFDTSVLNVGVDLNLLLQALNERTNVNILSEPRIFTSDNQEAEFFNGQDIPFVTDSQTTDNGTLNQSFDYRAVGINLRVRPRITVRRDVDLNINLELSSIQPNQTLFGGFIVDRRETTTHLIVKDGQTVVVSGILRSEDSDVKRKVPLLGDIPGIGLLFQSTEKTKRTSEIVAFITPIVIENDEQADAANRADRERLDQLRNLIRPPGDKSPDRPEMPPSSERRPYEPFEPGRGMDSGR